MKRNAISCILNALIKLNKMHCTYKEKKTIITGYDFTYEEVNKFIWSHENYRELTDNNQVIYAFNYTTLQ